MPALNRLVSKPVIYIGDYGEWAMVRPVSEPGIPEPVIVRRASIAEIAFGRAPETIPQSANTPPRDDPLIALVKDLGKLREHVAVLGSMLEQQRLSPPVSLTTILVNPDRQSGTQEDRWLNRIGMRYDIRQAVLDQLGGAGNLADIANCFDRPDFQQDAIAFQTGRRTSEWFLARAPVFAAEIARRAEVSRGPLLVFVQGGASPSGTRRYNLDLSERRAEWMSKTLHAALAAQQVPSDAVRIIDFGAGEQLNLRALRPQIPVSRIVMCEIGPEPDVINHARSIAENLSSKIEN